MADWSPGMAFPIGDRPAYANSQYFNIGGQGTAPPRDTWKSPANYKFPWRDNFCEDRPGSKRPNTACPIDHDGHQGQDIRPADGRDRFHPVLAPEDGVVVSSSGFTTIFLGDSVRRYTLLHMHPEDVMAGLPPDRRVLKGQPIGQARVSNYFLRTVKEKVTVDGKKKTITTVVAEPTTVHLHFEIKAPRIEGTTPSPTTPSSWRYVSPYVALVCAYG
jgi:murein DD-endopeptidase MepM/ murein hydrolase activator NlpD